MSDEAKLRKYKNTLVCSGTGVILFSAWSLIRFVLFLLTDFSSMRDYIYMSFNEGDSLSELYVTVLLWMVLIIVFILMLIDLIFRSYVGRRAIAIGKGKRDGGVMYIIYSAIIAAISASGIIYTFCGNYDITSISDTVSSLICEASSLFITIDLLYAAFMIRRLKDKQADS